MPLKARPAHPFRRVRTLTLSALSCLLLVSGPASLDSAWAQSAPVQPAAAAPAASAPVAPVPQAPAGTAAPGAAKAKPATKPGAKAPPAPKAPPGPKPLAAPPKSPVLSKSDIYQRSAPSVVFLIAKDGNRFNTALGVIVRPNGVVVSDSRLVSGVEKGQVYAFLYDASFAGDEDPLIFLRANQAKALPVQVVRMDAPNHLLQLQLPEPPPKQPYKAATTVGVDVIGLRTHGRQTLAMMNGSIMSVRPGVIETDPPLTLDHTGGPLLSTTGRLLGIVTFADKAVDTPGVARPVELLHSLLIGSSGGAVAAPANSAAEPAAESRNSVEAVRIALGNALAQKMDKRPALLLHSEFIHSMALRGRIPLRDLDSIEFMNSLVATITKDSPAKQKVVAELFPLIITDKKGRAYRRDGSKYTMVPTSDHGVVTIDDATGTLFTTDNRRSLIYYDLEGKSWRPTHISPVSQVAASADTLFAVLEDGRLIKATSDGKDSIQLWPKLLKGANVAASQGVMYLFDAEKIYRYRNGNWDNKMKPIAFSMQQLVVRGDAYYGLDLNGRVFSSSAQRYIDRDANIFKLWPIGRDLLVITKDNQRFFYSNEEDQWRPWTQW